MKAIILTTVVFLSLTSLAQKSINEIVCKTSPEANNPYVKSDVFLKLYDLTVTQNGEAGVKELYFTMINQDASTESTLPQFDSGSIEAKNLKSVSYRGRIYKNHIKFSVTAPANSRSGDLELDYAHLIISPDYTVVKTIDQANHWDKTWTWQIEVRKHSAVLAFSINDHHGDYLQLDCVSSARVNDSKRKD